ncbi:LysM peptidoglycan-binding domain-containing protein [Bacillus sp. FJAT-27251]|uniref:3D domain-containing protein n=1 Tax=Bacillus sp. FJAT-27251 TaxID=1684142 RepID=UPI0006A7EE00|nr:LysM peptidoglycan-binding domain-containing protein [Bacillus sp. FJAT-27251]
MKRKFLSLIAAAAFFITAAGSVQAEQVVVKQGDTLYGLSKQYGVSVASIKKWNNLSGDVIHPNQTLEVSPVKTVLVSKGDTLWNISQVYGVSVDNLMKWNSLSSDLIHPGLALTIYTDVHNAVPVKTEKAQNVQNVSAKAKKAPAQNAAPAKTTAQAKAKAPVAQTAAAQTSAPSGKEIMVEATAYTADCAGCIGITKTGVDLKANPNAKVIAVDPNVIPLGTKVYVQGYGYATAEDIGGAIKGNRIDVFIPEQSDALAWGRKQVKVTIVE